MLQLSESLLNKPVFSLRTGGAVATTISAIINPNNLKIEGFHCSDNLEKKKALILVSSDIRDYIPSGLVIDDYEMLVEASDLVRLHDIIELDFQLLNKPVYTEHKRRVGKVNDYVVESETLYVQKIYVAQSLLKSFSGGQLSVDRTQIVEITNKRIVIKDPLQPVKAEREAVPASIPTAAA